MRFVCSAYERPVSEDGSSMEMGSALLNGSGIRAVWMLMLALLFKMVSTIFTYGIKVLQTIIIIIITVAVLC